MNLIKNIIFDNFSQKQLKSLILAVFGFFGHFWLFLAIFGVFGHFWPFLAFLAIFGYFWPFLAFLAIFSKKMKKNEKK